MSPIRGILFDLWNTLISSDGPNPITDLGRRLRQAGVRDWLGALEQGMMLRPLPGIEAALPEVARAAGLSWTPEERDEAARAWKALSGRSSPFHDTLPVLGRLRTRYRLGLLSNTQSFDLDELRTSGVEQKLHTVQYSWDTGLLKPDPRAFDRACAGLGLPPGEVLMVGDNRRDDVEGARAAGLQAVLIRRSGDHLSHVEPETGDPVIRSLEELESRLGS